MTCERADRAAGADTDAATAPAAAA
ncbi:MAG: hypothetical protein QOJ43_854, partial [Gaiellaceae bacterium]|nr:hypothetical protein [Gaiellaceae bacterium]